jgi:eukaryotic-like serine/threonine-protein kinase
MNFSRDELQSALGDRYAIDRELGAGGMATVWLARDPRHDRRVAIKVLRPELAAVVGADRFLKEIRTTANLQHPHILPLHDSGEANGVVYYVMPFVEGETVRDRLRAEKQLSIDDAVRITREVAGALDYAHRQGVVHRDIKPENILLHDGSALIADFGIALALSRTEGASRMTETGMSLGTPHYMSPEQAMGEREITPRSDIYSLGCVLYEMLAGEPPFTGPSAQAIIARVVTEEPRSLTVQRRTVPYHVEAAASRAMAKLPADRFPTAAAFSDALADARPAPAISAGSAAYQQPVARSSRARWAAVGGAAVALLTIGAVAGWMAPRASESALPTAVVSIPIPATSVLAGSDRSGLAISADGRTIVFSGVGPSGIQLFLRRLDETTVTAIPGTQDAFEPVLSPDGSRVLFTRGNQAFVVSTTGGSPSAVPLLRGAANWIQWDADGSFVATGSDGGLARFRDGREESIARPNRDEGENFLIAAALVPGGRFLAIAATQGIVGPLWMMDAKGGTRKPVTSAFVAAATYHEGRIAWLLGNGSLSVGEWDDRRGALVGAGRTIATDVSVAPGLRPSIAFAASGSLVYQPAPPPELVRVSRDGTAEDIGGRPARYHSPRVSPDGRRIALDISDDTRDVWLLDLRDSTYTRATFENDGHDPHWLPDGRSLLYATSRASGVGIRRISLGSGEQQGDSVLYYTPQVSAHAVTSDGRIAVAAAASSGGFELIRIDLGTGAFRQLIASRYSTTWPGISPDDRWLAYVSDESGRPEVYLRPFDAPGQRIVVSTRGGTEPVWSRSGRELFYREIDSGALVAASISVEPELRVVSRTPLFTVTDYESSGPHANYDVTPDGSFIFVRRPRASELRYIQGWSGLGPRRD